MYYTNICNKCVSNLVLGIEKIYNLSIFKAKKSLVYGVTRAQIHTMKYIVSDNRIQSDIVFTNIHYTEEKINRTYSRHLYFLKNKIICAYIGGYYNKMICKFKRDDTEIFESDIDQTSYYPSNLGFKISSIAMKCHVVEIEKHVTKKIKYKNKIISRKSHITTDGLGNILLESYKNPKNTAQITKLYYKDGGKLKQYIKNYGRRNININITKYFYKNGNIDRINYIDGTSRQIMMRQKYKENGEQQYVKFRTRRYGPLTMIKY